nr:MAG TPA: hypothetical protein [Caudoviricetes sp.]
MTPTEREYVLRCIANDIEQQNEMIRKSQENIKR